MVKRSEKGEKMSASWRGVGNLTAREWDTFKAYQDFFEEHGRAPSLREVARIVGVSHERVRQHLIRIVNEGYLIKIGRIGQGVFPREALERILSENRKQEAGMYKNWEEAANKSRMRMAVSEAFWEPVYSKARKKVEMVKVEIIKPMFGDPYVVYAGTSFKIRNASAKECDGKLKWKSYR